MLTHATDIAETFGLGAVLTARQVEGGLSNDLWRVETDAGTYAVKVMRTNAEAPDFGDNIEQAFAVEVRAFDQGVPCPEPVPAGALCLANISGDLVRVHRWVDGRAVSAPDWLESAGALIARIHASGVQIRVRLDDDPWDTDGWAGLAEHPDMPRDLARQLRASAADLARLEAFTAASGRVTVHCASHGDLDPKNTLDAGGTLVALDWDAAGTRCAIREAVAVGLDWGSDIDEFCRVIASYGTTSRNRVPAEPWTFGGWVSATGGWLVHNATERIGTPLGQTETRLALDRLVRLHASLPAYLAALAQMD